MIKNKGTKNYGRFLKQCFIKIIIFYNFSSFLIKSFQRSKCILQFKLLFITFFCIIFQNDAQISLNSNNIYSRLNDNASQNLQDNIDECEQMDDILSNTYSKFKDFCMNLNRILQNFNNLSFPGAVNNDKCTIIKLWTYEQIYNLMPDFTQNDEFEEIIRIVGSICNNYLEDLSVCHIYTDRIYKEEFKNIKKLYDYVENYENIESHLKEKGYTCTKNLKSYKDEIQDIYLRLKVMNIPVTHIYNRILQDFEKVNTEKKLLAVKCEQIIDQEPSSEDSKPLVASPESDSSQALELSGSLVGSSSKLPRQQVEEGSVGSENAVEVAVTDASPKPEMSSYKGGADLSDKVTMDENLFGDHNESVIPPKLSTIGATVAGSSLFLLMMYKFTPLGSWVSTKILGRNKLIENMSKNNYELHLNDVGNRESSLNDPMYHIRYNSATNH